MIRSRLIACLIAIGAMGCQTRPAITSVWSTTHRETIARADRDLFLTDRASRIRGDASSLPASKQGESFRVHWRGDNIERVEFEYRQVNRPEKISRQVFQPFRQHSTTFWILGDEFHQGGPVSAWRVSLWAGNELLAETKSALW
jgi:hypothetical protein